MGNEWPMYFWYDERTGYVWADINRDFFSPPKTEEEIKKIDDEFLSSLGVKW